MSAPLWATERRATHAELFEAEYEKQLERIARIRSEVSAGFPAVPERVPPPSPPRREHTRWDSAPADFAPSPARARPAAPARVAPVPARRRGAPVRRAAVLGLCAVSVVFAAAAVLLAARPARAPESNVFHVASRPSGIVSGGGRLWITGPGMVTVLDGETLRQAATPGAPGPVALDARFAWITDARRGVLVRVSPDGSGSVRTIAMHRGVADVIVAGGAVWTASPDEGTLRVFDPVSRRQRSIPAGARPVALAAAGARVVAVDAAGTLIRFDARSRRSVGAPVLLGGAPIDVALAGDRAWVVDSGSGTVRAVDFASGRVRPAERVCRGPIAVAADRTAAYVLCRGERTLVRLDPLTGVVRSRTALAYVPTAIALDSRHVWIAAEPNEVIRVDR